MTEITLHHGDNREHLRRLIDQGVRVHSVVTDPPYGLVSVTKRFGADAAAPAKFGTDGAFARASAGFMGSKWDGTGIERDPEFWRLIHEILLPGGYVVAFASSRTFHRMAVAIEDAGFITHPMLGWVTGSGFPKAHNAAMAIDKHLGVQGGKDNGRYVPGSPKAEQWDGWAYGAQALKPALEPIYVGQKPFDGKTGAPSILKHGVGALNIDGSRVAVSPEADASQLRTMHRSQRTEDTNGQAWGLSKNGCDEPAVVRPEGRHPANLLHDGSDEVVALFPQSAGQIARARNGGSAARFFSCFPTDLDPSYPGGTQQEHPPLCDPIFYHPKAGKTDRAGSKHPTVKPIALMRWLCRLITPPGGLVLDPFAGSGTTAEAARQEGFNCLLMEADDTYAREIRVRFSLPSPDDEDAFDDLLEEDSFDVFA